MSAIDESAEAITTNLQGQGVGAGSSNFLDFIKGLLPVLLQLLPMCAAFLGQAPKDQTPKEFADEHWDEASGQYDRDVVRAAGRRVRQRARKKGHGVSRSDAEATAVACLDQARNS